MSGKVLLALASLVALLPGMSARAADGSLRFAATVPFHDCDGMICSRPASTAARRARWRWIPAMSIR